MADLSQFLNGGKQYKTVSVVETSGSSSVAGTTIVSFNPAANEKVLMKLASTTSGADFDILIGGTVVYTGTGGGTSDTSAFGGGLYIGGLGETVSIRTVNASNTGANAVGTFLEEV